MKRDKYGFYAYPPRPPGLPADDDYPRKYTLKSYSTEEINDNRYQNSIRGRTICRMEKADDIPRIINDKTEIHAGYVPGYSNLNFRSMVLGIIKPNDQWLVVERTKGINLMPFDASTQLSLFPTQEIKGGKTRKEAIEIAEEHVKGFSDQQWINIQEQITYELSGIDFEYIKTPEQQRIEDEYGEKIREINNLNEWIRTKQNFINHYKPLRVHKTHTKRMKMVNLPNGMRIPEKLNPRHKTKFLCFQKHYSSNLEVEGIIMPIEIDGLTELRELVVVKGDQFKGTPAQESYSSSEYIICEPYTGSLMSFKSAKSLKETLEHIPERLMILIEPDNIEKINNYIRLHNEKIETLHNEGDITQYLLDEYPSYNTDVEQQAA